jgi:hypothetical protein
VAKTSIATSPGVLIEEAHELGLAGVHFKTLDRELNFVRRKALFVSMPARRISAPTRVSTHALNQWCSLGSR